MAKPKAPKFPTLPGTGEAVQRVTTKSVMTPHLLFAALCIPTLVPALMFTTGRVQELILYIIMAAVADNILALLYFSLRDPDRLQSEEFRTEMRRIDIIGEPGKPATTLDLRAEQTPNLQVEDQIAGEIDGR